MKLKINNTDICIDMDPADLSDEDLQACIAVATERGLLLNPQTDMLTQALERAYSSILRDNITIAVAQIACVLPPETQVRLIKGALADKFHRSNRSDRAQVAQDIAA
jgi:hypothetical protein